MNKSPSRRIIGLLPRLRRLRSVEATFLTVVRLRRTHKCFGGNVERIRMTYLLLRCWRSRLCPMNYLVNNDPNDIFTIEMLVLHVRSACERIALRY